MGYNYCVKVTEKDGRGLWATQEIKKNKIITECELLVLNELDTALVNQTALQFYTFKYEGKKDCLVLGDGELFNHSDTANVGYVLQIQDDRKFMVFYALQDIPTGEQLCIDYNADEKIDFPKYLGNDLR